MGTVLVYEKKIRGLKTGMYIDGPEMPKRAVQGQCKAESCWGTTAQQNVFDWISIDSVGSAQSVSTRWVYVPARGAFGLATFSPHSDPSHQQLSQTADDDYGV